MRKSTTNTLKQDVKSAGSLTMKIIKTLTLSQYLSKQLQMLLFHSKITSKGLIKVNE